MTITASPIRKSAPLPDNSPLIVSVIDLPFLAREVNDAHKQVTFHCKSMLAEAKRAGEALLEVKKRVQHGEFQNWIKRNCSFSYDTAKDYMNVAKKGACSPFDESMSIRAVLGRHAQPRAAKMSPTPVPVFTREDAIYTMKIHALAERGSTEAERLAAHGKLESFAKGFNASAGDLVTQARRMLPDWEKSEGQVQQEAEHRRAAERDVELQELQRSISRIEARTKVLKQAYYGKTKTELVELCVRMTLNNEGLIG